MKKNALKKYLQRDMSTQISAIKNFKISKAFTIVEIVIVVAVMGILAAITYVSYNSIIDSSREETIKADAQAAGGAVNRYKADKGSYPVSLVGVDIPKVSSKLQYTYNAGLGTYCITASIDDVAANVRSGTTAPSMGGCSGHSVPAP